MKKTNIIATLTIIALSATQIMALELNIDADEEITQGIKATVTQELNSQAQENQELPDYNSLNQQFINKLEKAAAESEYETINECYCWSRVGGSLEINSFHPPVKEIYDDVLASYKNLLQTLGTIRKYNKENREKILDLISQLDSSIHKISEDERSEYIKFLCEKDRYYLKAKDSIVNLAFLIDKENPFLSLRFSGELGFYCAQEPVKIKVHSLWKYITSPEYLEEVGQGFQSEVNAGK